MKTSIINFKTDPKLKRQAQKKADELGISLTAALNAFLRDFLKAEDIVFVGKEKKLELSDWAKKELLKEEKEKREGYVSPVFSSIEDEIAWLNDSNAKYANGSSVRKKN